MSTFISLARTASVAAAASFASLSLTGATQAAEQRFGAVVVYADPIEAGAPAGEAFAAPSEARVVQIAVESCKANTVKSEWASCAVGRWIGTGQHRLVATSCDAIDERGEPHSILFFTQDGVTATDAQIRQEAQRRILHGTITRNGCRKIAAYDRDKPARTEPEDSLIARSIAVDKAR